MYILDRSPELKPQQYSIVMEKKLDIVDSDKYLGLWFDEFLSLQKGTRILAQSASRTLGVVIGKFKLIGGSLFKTHTKTL